MHLTILVRGLLLIFLVLSTFLFSSGQQNDPVIIQQKSAEIEIIETNAAPKITERFSSTKVFHSHFDQLANESIFFSDLKPIIDINAFTTWTTPEKKHGKKTIVTNFETKDLVMPGIFYGGYKQMDFTYPNLSPNATGTLTYTQEIKELHLISPFFFEDRFPVKEASFSVIFPK